MAFTRSGTQNMSVRKRREGSHAGIAHIEAKIKYHNISASGFLVKVGEHFIVLTAASNLYDEEKGIAEKVLVSFGRERDTFPHGVIVRKDEHLEVPTEHKEGRYGFDYGVISLQTEDYDFNKLPYFTLNKLGMYMKRMPEIHMIGYSTEGNDVRQMTMRLTKPKIDDACIKYEYKTFPGNNGSPLYIERNGMYVAVGIHVKTASEGNSCGILITSAVKAHIQELVHHLFRTLEVETDSDAQAQLRHQKARSRHSYHGPSTTESTMDSKLYGNCGKLRKSKSKSSSTLDHAEASRSQQSSRKQSDHNADVYDSDAQRQLRHQKARSRHSYHGPSTTESTMDSKLNGSCGKLGKSKSKSSSTLDHAEASRSQQSSRKQSDHNADVYDSDAQRQLRHQKARSRHSFHGPSTTESTMGNNRYDSYGQLRESKSKSSSTLDHAEASRSQQSSRKQSDHNADVHDRKNILQGRWGTRSETDVSYSAGKWETKELKQAQDVQFQQAEYQAFIPSQKVDSSKAQNRDCKPLTVSGFSSTARKHRNILIPSNLPLSPMVRQLDDTFEELEKILIKKDGFSVLPSVDLPSCPLRSKIFQTLNALSSSGLILMTSSLCELMHVSSHVDQPEEILLELFGVYPSIPTFVLCVIHENRKVEYLSDYIRDLTGNIQHGIRKFTSEKISSVHGTVMMSNFDSKETFRETLNEIKRNSGKFCNSNSLFMNKGKYFNVSRACLVAMAASEKIPDTCRNVEIRLGSKEDLFNHLDTMNKSCTLQLQQKLNINQLITSQEDVSACDTRASWASEGHSRNYKNRKSSDFDWQSGRIARDVSQVAHQMFTSTVVEDTTLSCPGYRFLAKTPELQSEQLMPQNEQSLERISTSSDLPLSQTHKPTIQSDVRSELSFVPRGSETSTPKHVSEPLQLPYRSWGITKDADGEEKTKARKSPSYKERQAEKEESEKRNSLESIPTGLVQLLKRQFNA